MEIEQFLSYLATDKKVSAATQIQKLKNLHDNDLMDGFGAVWLPDALETKYPNAPIEIQWQYLFPSMRRSIDPRSGIERSHHIKEHTIQRAIKVASKSINIKKRVTCHTFRHSYSILNISRI